MMFVSMFSVECKQPLFLDINTVVSRLKCPASVRLNLPRVQYFGFKLRGCCTKSNTRETCSDI